MTGNPMCNHEWVPVVGGPMRCKWCGARLEAKAAPDGPPEPGSSIPAMEKARRFPTNTCGASRHAGEIAEDLIRHGEHGLLADDAKHCGESIGWTVAALWEARSELAALRSQVAERDRKIEWLSSEWAEARHQRADLQRRLTEATEKAAEWETRCRDMDAGIRTALGYKFGEPSVDGIEVEVTALRARLTEAEARAGRGARALWSLDWLHDQLLHERDFLIGVGLRDDDGMVHIQHVTDSMTEPSFWPLARGSDLLAALEAAELAQRCRDDAATTPASPPADRPTEGE